MAEFVSKPFRVWNWRCLGWVAAAVVLVRVVGCDEAYRQPASGSTSLVSTVERLAHDGRGRPLGSDALAAMREKVRAEVEALGGITREISAFVCAQSGPCAPVVALVASPPTKSGARAGAGAVALVAGLGSAGAGPAVAQSIAPTAVVLQTLKEAWDRQRQSPQSSNNGAIVGVFVDGAEGALALQEIGGELAREVDLRAWILVRAFGVLEPVAVLRSSEAGGAISDIMRCAPHVEGGGPWGSLAVGLKSAPSTAELGGRPFVELALVGGGGVHETARDRLGAFDMRAAFALAEAVRCALSAWQVPEPNVVSSPFVAIRLGAAGAVAVRPLHLWAFLVVAWLLLIWMARSSVARPASWDQSMRALAVMPTATGLAAALASFLSWTVKAQLGLGDLGSVSAIWARLLLACSGLLAAVLAPLLVARRVAPQVVALAGWAWVLALTSILMAVSASSAAPLVVGAVLGTFGLLLLLLRASPLSHAGVSAAGLAALVWWWGPVFCHAEALWGLGPVLLFVLLGAPLLAPLSGLLLALPARRWGWAVGISFALALAAVLGALAAPPFGPLTPRRINLAHVEGEAGDAYWIASDPYSHHLPPVLVDVAAFAPPTVTPTGPSSGESSGRPDWWLGGRTVRVASAQPAGNGFARVTTEVSGEIEVALPVGADRLVVLWPDAAGVSVQVGPDAVDAFAAPVQGQRQRWRALSIYVPSSKGGVQSTVKLKVQPPTPELVFAAGWLGLPADAAPFQAARDSDGAAFGEGDRSWTWIRWRTQSPPP